MSRRIWQTEDGYGVSVGWDPPTSAYFLDIGRECTRCEEGELPDGSECSCVVDGMEWVYNNLDDKSSNVDRMGGIHDLQYIVNTLNKHLTVWPTEVLATLFADQEQDLANATSRYSTMGEVKQE